MSNWTDERPDVFLGIENLPAPIVNYLQNSIRKRRELPKVYHVTELLYCLRKVYYTKTVGRDDFSISSLWNIFRGNTFDNRFSPLFEKNQINYTSHRNGLTITGTLDFVWLDEDNFDPVLYDLKMPASVFYRKKTGASEAYKQQVQMYLALAHENGELLDVHRCRVMMLAEDLVMTEVPENDALLEQVWERTLLLDEALETKNSSILIGPEVAWECKKPYCPADVEFRKECAKCPNYPL